METKAIAITAVFTALTVALSRFIVPAPYFPFIFYEIWEIPIVAIFLFLSPKYGFSILLLNTTVAFVFLPAFANPGLNPIYGLVACSSMLAGMLLASKLSNRAISGENIQHLSRRKYLLFSTALGIIFRVIVMMVFIYPVSVWIMGLPVPYVISTLPLIAIFNVTLPLYTIPLGYLIANKVGKTFRTTAKN